MTLFVLFAAALTVLGVALIAVPLLKARPAEYAPAPWTAMIAAGVLAVGSTVLYLSLTNWSWRSPPAGDTPQTMVARLARKLEKDPQDLNGWLMLGRSYTVLQQYPLAARAYERADRLSGGKSVEALVGEAEALSLGDESQLDGRAGRLIERALQIDPDSGKALFFGAAVAMRRGELPLARERFSHLLTLNPPDNIKPLLQKQIESIDQQMSGSAPSGTGGGPRGVGGAVGGGNGGASESGALANSNAKVRINVMLAPSLNSSATGSSPLFVFVRDPDHPGPPLAVKRLDTHFPQSVELTASDSMVPGRAIAPGQKVLVVARIARSGSPVGASGDPFGEVPYTVGQDGLINIVIDRVQP